MHLFTPRTKNHVRETWHLNDEDIRKIGRGTRWNARVTNQDTGKQYQVRGASCGAPHCLCDAIIVKEIL